MPPGLRSEQRDQTWEVLPLLLLWSVGLGVWEPWVGSLHMVHIPTPGLSARVSGGRASAMGPGRPA